MHMKIKLNKFRASGYECFSRGEERWFAALRSHLGPLGPATGQGSVEASLGTLWRLGGVGGTQHLPGLLWTWQHWSLQTFPPFAVASGIARSQRQEHQPGDLLRWSKIFAVAARQFLYVLQWASCLCFCSLKMSLWYAVQVTISANQVPWPASCTLRLYRLFVVLPNCKSLCWNFPRSANLYFCRFYFNFGVRGNLSQNSSSISKSEIRGKIFAWPRCEVFWEQGFEDCKRTCPVAAVTPPRALEKISRSENKNKNHPRFGHCLSPSSAFPFLFPCCMVAIPAGAAVAAGLLVPWAGGCPRLAPSAPSIGVTALPGQCHSCAGAAPDGITTLLHCAPVFPELQPLGSCGFNSCLKWRTGDFAHLFETN